MWLGVIFVLFFFYNDTATNENYTLSLNDALTNDATIGFSLNRFPFTFHTMVKRTKEGSKKGMPEVVSLETTIHMHKHLVGTTFKRRAPTAVKRIKQYATKFMGTKDVRIEVKLNKFIWSQGIKGVPPRIRVRMDRKRNEDEEAKEPLYTIVSYVHAPTFKGLLTHIVDDAE